MPSKKQKWAFNVALILFLVQYHHDNSIATDSMLPAQSVSLSTKLANN